ncbi:hypothetical protein C0995_007068, partial [Termitomyces sp. Mi166
MEKSDILAELWRLREFTDATIDVRDAWGEVRQIKEKLSLLCARQCSRFGIADFETRRNSEHHRLLSTLYDVDGVQINSSAPFRRAMAIDNLKQQAQEAVARLE